MFWVKEKSEIPKQPDGVFEVQYLVCIPRIRRGQKFQRR